MSEATDVHVVGSTSKRERSETPLSIDESPESTHNETDIQFLGARVKRPRPEAPSEGSNSEAPGPASRPIIRRRSTTNPLRQIVRERPQLQRVPESVPTGRQTQSYPYLTRGALPVSLRRPVVSRMTPPTQQVTPSAQEEVIDLTSDQSVGSVGSPEVEFVRSRPRTPPSDSGASLSFEYPLRPSSQITRSGASSSDFNRVYYDAWANRSPSSRILIGGAYSRIGPVWRPSVMTFEEQPVRRDFENVYKAPSPAPDGFARSVVEDEVAVCPHCDDELGTGEGKKQEIWAAKCGHAYCGECAANRSVKAAQQNSAKAFAVCRIPDCGLRVSAKTAFIQLFV